MQLQNSLEELTELWRSFFEDSRFHPPRDDSGEEYLTVNFGDHIEKLASQYPEKKRPLMVTWDSLSDFSPILSTNLKWNMTKCLNAAKKAVKGFITPDHKERVQEEHGIEIELDVAPVGVPDELYKKEIRELRKEHLYRLVKIRGIIRKSLAVRPRMEIAYFECNEGAHAKRLKQDFFRLKDPDKRCGAEGGMCKSIDYTLREEKSVFVDSQKMEIQEIPEGLPRGSQPERLTIYAEGSLAANVQPGDRASFIGMIMPKKMYHRGTQKKSEFEIYLYVAGIEETDSEQEEVEINDEELAELRQYAEREDVDKMIARSIAPSVFGLDSQKEGIALLMFGGVPKEMEDGTRIRGDLNMLMMGDPGIAKSQLLRSVAELSPRGVMTTGKSTSAAGLTATVVRDDFGDGRWTLEAGALVLASGGVACVDEIDKMDTDDRSAMHEALEQQTVTITKAGINSTLQARCAVLAAANPRLGRIDTNMSIAGQIDMPVTLLSRFDIFFIMRDVLDNKKDEKLASRILESHRRGESIETDNDDDRIPLDTLKKYIKYAKKLRPVLTDDAMEIIKDFYTGMRRAYGREQEQMGMDSALPVTPRQLESLIRMSEAYAKMEWSPTVELRHAEKAVDIMDQFIDVTLQGDMGGQTLGMNKNERLRKRRMGENPVAEIRKIVKDAESDGGIKEEQLIDKLIRDGNFTRQKAEGIIRQMRDDGLLILGNDYKLITGDRN